MNISYTIKGQLAFLKRGYKIMFSPVSSQDFFLKSHSDLLLLFFFISIKFLCNTFYALSYFFFTLSKFDNCDVLASSVNPLLDPAHWLSKIHLAISHIDHSLHLPYPLFVCVKQYAVLQLIMNITVCINNRYSFKRSLKFKHLLLCFFD